MERLPLDRSVLDSALERMDIADIAQATIRQSGDIARILENETGTEFLHLEMGVPGLPPEQVGVEAECKALRRSRLRVSSARSSTSASHRKAAFRPSARCRAVSHCSCSARSWTRRRTKSSSSTPDSPYSAIRCISSISRTRRSTSTSTAPKSWVPSWKATSRRATWRPSSTPTPTIRHGYVSRKRSCAPSANWRAGTTPSSSRIWPTSAWTSANRWDGLSKRPISPASPVIRRIIS